MKTREILGHIDCPTCGTAKGMRITADKNGEPFGFCEANCGQQLRVGGDKRRVRDFVARHPWAAPVTEQPAATKPVTVTEQPKPVQVQEQKPAAPKRQTVANPFDFLLQKGAKT